MVTESLAKRIKEILAVAKSGKVDEALASYKALFEDAEFATYPINERRQTIKLVVNAKIPPHMPSKAVVEAHRAAIKPLEDMIGEGGEPIDFELLGICLVFTQDEKRAAETFRTGLKIARERNSASDVCGSLMKWVAAV